MIYADQRWIGQHGIGHFARHVLTGLDYRPVPLSSNPAAPLDSWFLARALRQLTSDDLFFSPGYNTPLSCRSPFIFTLHDLSHLYCPELNSPAIRLYYATVVKRACRRAAAILTVSEFSKKQIVDWSRISPEKIFNVWSGVDSIYQIEGDSYGLPFPYILSVSNRKPHKNGLRIVEAFAKASLNPQIHLVFTGKPCAQFLHCIEAQQLHSRVDFLGFVPEAKMPSLYRGAEALIFPSLSEGFGLPILEAMACGIPVVTSNAAAMPEVAGDAALLVDPTSVEEIAAAMERIVSDTALRQMLQEKGLNRAKDFPWTKTSSEVHKVIGIIR